MGDIAVKKTIVLIIALCLCLSMCSCNSIDKIKKSLAGTSGSSSDASEAASVNSKDYTADAYSFPNNPAEFTPVSEDDYFCYQYLNKKQKTAYKALVNAAQHMNMMLFSVGKCTSNDVAVAVQAVMCDYPQLFWLNQSYGTQIDDKDAKVTFNDPDGDYSYICADETDRNYKMSQMYAKIDDFIKAEINASMSQYEIELKVHDWLCSITDYDNDAAGASANRDSRGYEESWTAYGAIMNGKAVCAGYARAYQLVMNYLGINCTCIMAQSNDQIHMVNAVCIDNKWYYVDVTWDDDAIGDLDYIHDYFNLSYAEISGTHLVFESFNTLDSSADFSESKFNIALPEAADTEKNYYSMKDLYISSEGEFKQKISSIFSNASANGKNTVEVRLGFCTPTADLMKKLIKDNDIMSVAKQYYGPVKNISYGIMNNGAIYLRVNKR